MDAASLPATGFTLAHFTGLEAQRWDVLSFRTPAATAAATLDASVPSADRDAMVAGGCTFLVGGAIDNPSGELRRDERLRARDARRVPALHSRRHRLRPLLEPG